MKKVELSKEQQFVVDKITSTDSGFHFITGKAGTGKSTIVDTLKRMDRTIVVAPTGIAAINVGGQTIHSFFKIRPKPFTPSEGRAISKKIFDSFDTLVIDEASMVRVDMMQYINNALRNSDKYGREFGGKKIVSIGDLSQLPPIVRKGSEDEEVLDYHYSGKYFFKAPVFDSIHLNVYKLNHVFRQEESQFLDLVNNVRYGNITTPQLDYINGMVGDCDDDVTRLCTINAKVDSINKRFLAKIDDKEWTYKAKPSKGFSGEPPAPELLTLKVGAKVMFLANTEDFVNGEMGVVIHLKKDTIKIRKGKESIYVDVHEWNHKKYAVSSTGKLSMESTSSYKQFPLKLAYAISIHKSQGLTIEKGHLVLGNGCFAHGQLYVALSRLKSDAGLTLETPIRYSDLIFDNEVKDIKNSNYTLFEYSENVAV